VDKVHGHMGGLQQFMPMTSDALILGYSCTKAIAATLAHVMVTEGYLSYDEPICERVWKEFCPLDNAPEHLVLALGLDKIDVEQRWAWKRKISLRHILTHSAGLWHALPLKLTIHMLASCERCCQSFEYIDTNPAGTLLPTCEPGSSTEYHFMSFGWLLAGSLIGAYAAKHGKDRRRVKFEDIYNLILSPKLSERTRSSGFFPCGGGSALGFSLAFTHVDDRKLTEMLQRQSEMEAVGVKTAYSEALAKIRETFRGKEFLLDNRIWNSRLGQIANCPAAGGRFTARALASFYHDLGRDGQILDAHTFYKVSETVGTFTTANTMLQGETNMTANSEIQMPQQRNNGRAVTMGYQRITFPQSHAIGHAGVGGSIGFYHPNSGCSVAIMLNKADASEQAAARIIREISDHCGW
jgi:CubicO group peptidase (beta-lactamase class C family)